MKLFVKYFLILYSVSLCFSISISGILDPDYKKGSPVFLAQHPMPDNPYNEGIFEKFIRSLLDLLSTKFPERKLTRYCRVMNRALRGLSYRHTKYFAKHLRYLSRMYRDDLKQELVKYRKEYDKKLPYRTEFLQGMNQVFTLRENLLFNDYLYDLRDYGNEDKLFIYEETRKIFHDVIINSINKLNARDRYELEKKLKRAVKEYIRVSG